MVGALLSPARRPFGLGEGDRLRLNARTPTRVCLLCRCCCAIDRRVGWVPRAVSQGEGGRVGSAAPMRVRAGVGPARSLLSLCRRSAFA